MYRSELLLGSDHIDLGEFWVAEVGPHLAVGISRGRFPKGYASTEPNEDAVFAGTDGTTTVLAVADGHHGAETSHVAIEAISEITAATIGEAGLSQRLVARVSAVGREAEGRSDTAVTICVLGNTTVEVATFGDTAVTYATERAASTIGGSGPFLRSGHVPEITTQDTSVGAVWAAASDGIIDFVPQMGDLLMSLDSNDTAAGCVEALIQEAFEGGAGDNLAVAVWMSYRL